MYVSDLTFFMASLSVGQRISIKDYKIHWEDGRTSPSWCVEPGRNFEIIEKKQRADGSYRIVIGNHRLNNGPITKGVTGAIIVV